MAIPQFVVPSWLNDQDAETIHKRMMDALPADIDDTEGGFPWDLTKPSALEKAEMLEFHLVQTLKIIFPAWADGAWLDLHAKARGLTRKPPNKATGTLLVTGVSGTTIPAGFRFASPAKGSAAAIEYEAVERFDIAESGMVEVQIRAIEAGIIGNVPAGAVTLMMTPLKGITSITNQAQITGGTAEEEDDALRTRIDELDATAEASFVGSDGDYKRWAEEVPGVGTALPMPEWDGPGTVNVIVIDANGQPANSTIITAVYNSIVSPEDRLKRKAPVGATVTVAAPTAKVLNYTFLLEIESGETLATVLERFATELRAYYIEAKKASVVRYNKVSSIITETTGVKDFTGLLINGAAANVDLTEDEYPVTGTIDPYGGGAP